jgi:SNF2 family DNA or RNA helicase
MAQQRAAVAKMLPTRIGALFMEMGTGKSRTAIELALLRRENIDQVVWFCPVSLKQTVRQEIRKHTDCGDADINIFGEKTSERNLPACFWHVVGIESMSASNRVVCTVNKLITERTLVIVDESSYIKGHNASRTRRLTHIAERARYRLILTGTPISQGVVDLFAQMRFLSPKILGYRSFYSFAANHLEYHEKFKGMIVRSHNTEYLAAKIQPYVYQVTKDECLDLPDKLYERRYFDMSREQRGWYETAKDELLRECELEDWSSIAIFRLFGALQQIVCGFWNKKTGEGAGFIEMRHRRDEMLLDTVTSIPPQEKVIIWAKYLHDIEQITAVLTETFGAESVAPFHGKLNERQRAAQVERFRGPARFFLATPSSGGHGLTLNEAHYVVFYNNGFKFSERIQAEDRCHRIGQEHRVVYIDLVCDESIDERIMQALAGKGDVVEEFKREVEKIKGSKNRLKKLVEGL